jgi:hypothetical protein
MVESAPRFALLRTGETRNVNTAECLGYNEDGKIGSCKRQYPEEVSFLDVGSPTWIRTTIKLRYLESVTYRFEKGLDSLFWHDLPPSVQYRYSPAVERIYEQPRMPPSSEPDRSGIAR